MITSIIELCPLILGCIFLVWGLRRLQKIVKSEDHLIKRSSIITQVTAYIFVVLISCFSVVASFNAVPLEIYIVATSI